MKNFKKYVFTFFALLFLGLGGVFAQEKDKNLPKANEEYEKKEFAEAEANYRISDSKFSNKAAAPYNLGNAIYRQNQASEAKYAYEKALRNANSRDQKHKAYHNLGNVFMKEKNYTQAVEAYKNALRNNPNDEETRYNFALAKKMLKENPPKNDKNDKDKNDKNKDKDKNKKDQDKDKKDDKNKDQDKDKDKKDQDKKDNKKDNDKDKNDKEEEPKPKPGGISKQRLESLLDAVNNEEKKIQDKVNAKKVQGKPVDTDKDW